MFRNSINHALPDTRVYFAVKVFEVIYLYKKYVEDVAEGYGGDRGNVTLRARRPSGATGGLTPTSVAPCFSVTITGIQDTFWQSIGSTTNYWYITAPIAACYTTNTEINYIDWLKQHCWAMLQLASWKEDNSKKQITCSDEGCVPNTNSPTKLQLIITMTYQRLKKREQKTLNYPTDVIQWNKFKGELHEFMYINTCHSRYISSRQRNACNVMQVSYQNYNTLQKFYTTISNHSIFTNF